MITKNVNPVKPVGLTEEEAMSELDFYLERINEGLEEIKQSRESFLMKQRETRALIDSVDARLKRL